MSQDLFHWDGDNDLNGGEENNDVSSTSSPSPVRRPQNFIRNRIEEDEPRMQLRSRNFLAPRNSETPERAITADRNIESPERLIIDVDPMDQNNYTGGAGNSINARQNGASSAQPRRRIKKRSEVWQVFSPVPGREAATCDNCNRPAILTRGNNTTGLWRHLRTHHPEIYERLSPSKQKKAPTKARPQDAFRPNHPRAERITRRLGMFMALDFQPYSSVAGEGMQGLLEELEPRYVIPHPTTFSRTVIPSITNEYKEKVKAVIQKDIENGKLLLIFSTYFMIF